MKKKSLLWGILTLGLLCSAQASATSFEKHSLLQPNHPRGDEILAKKNPTLPNIDAQKNKRSSLPSAYYRTDLEIPVKNQGSLGICWAYSGSDLLSASFAHTTDKITVFSPNYYNYLAAGNAFTNRVLNPDAILFSETQTRPLNDGNTLDYVATISMLGKLPVLDADFSTPNDVIKSTSMNSQDFNRLSKYPLEVTDIYALTGENPNAFNTTTRNNRITAIKQAIYDHGGVQFSIDGEKSLFPSNYYSGSTHASYIPMTEASQDGTFADGNYYLNVDHAVIILGWDDAYSKNNFNITPSRDGAFKVKNSWGKSWGDEGYYYVSYDDLQIFASDLYAVRANTAPTNQKESKYVSSSPVNYALFSKTNYPLYNNACFANVFKTSDVDETLNAVSFYSLQKGIKIRVLLAEKAIAQTNNVNTTPLQSLGEYTLTDIGFHKLVLPTSKTLGKNKEYTVAIQVLNAESFSTFAIPYQECFGTKISPFLASGKSYLSNQSGGKIVWEELSQSSHVNLYIAAYTSVNLSNNSYAIENDPLPDVYQGDIVNLESYARCLSSDNTLPNVVASSYNEKTTGEKSITFTAKAQNGKTIQKKENFRVLPLLTLTTKNISTTLGSRVNLLDAVTSAKNNKTEEDLLLNVTASTPSINKVGTFPITFTLKASNNGEEFTYKATANLTVKPKINKSNQLYSVQKNTTVYSTLPKLGKSNVLGNAGNKNIYRGTVKVSEFLDTGHGTYAKIYIRPSLTSGFTKCIGFIEKSSLAKNNILKSVKTYKKTLSVRSANGTFYNKPYVKGAKKLRTTKNIANKKVQVTQKAIVDKTTYYKVYANGKYLGWLKSSYLK